MASEERWTLIGAASRTGKTYAGARIFLKRLLADYGLVDEEREYWCVAPTYDDCRAQKLELLKIIPRELIDVEKQGGKGEFFDESHGRGVLFLVGGVTIILKSAERPERLVAFKLRGIWWTEIARSKVAAWPNVYSRLSNYPDSWFVADTSPLGHCWFYQEVWKPAKEGRFENASTHEWKAVDSPYVPASVIEEARRNLMPAFFKREFEASWEAFVGQIYDISADTHLFAECPFRPDYAILTADINTTSTHPAEFMWTYYQGDGKRRRAWVAGCYQKVIGLDYDTYALDIAAQYQRLLRMFPGRVKVRIDPSFHNAFKTKLRGLGVSIQNAYNEVLPTIRMLGSALVARPLDHYDDWGKPVWAAYPSLTFGPAAQPVLEQIAGMRWMTGSDGVVRDTVDKSADDGWHDSARYMAAEVFPAFGPARQIQ